MATMSAARAFRGAFSSTLTMVCSVQLLAACGQPDTPSNSLLELFVDDQMGRNGEVQDGLCERLRDAPSDDEREVLDRVLAASASEVSLVEEDGRSALVSFRAIEPPSRPGDRGELWYAEMVVERGSWRVCGFQLEP